MTIEVDNDDDNNKVGNASNSNTAPKASSVKENVAQPKQAQASQRPVQSTNSNTAVNNQSNNTTNNSQQKQGNRNMNISSRQNYGMSRAAGSIAMRTIVEVIDKIAESEADQPVKFSFMNLDGEKEGLLISALVVAATMKNPGNDQRYVAHHTLLLAATARGATEVEQTVILGNQNVKYQRLVVAADAYDGTLRARVSEVLQGQFPGYTLIDSDATVVPADLDLKSEEAVRNVIANATTATSTLLASVIANDAWVIDEEAIKQTFQVEIKSSWDHFTDLTAQPVRGDVVIEMAVLTGKNLNQSNNAEFQYNTSQARRTITQLFGYIDLVSTPPQASNSFGLFGQASNMVSKAEEMRIFTPRLVITNTDAPEEPIELPIALQGLATAQVLYNDGRWVSALVQQHKNGAQHADNGVNIRDLSVIGLEAPVMIPAGYMNAEVPKAQRLPLNSATVGDAMLAAAVQTYVNPDLLISMDVPECGASSWVVSPFAAAARGDQNAIRDIFEAADLLTRGAFTPIYKALNKGTMPNPFFNDNMFVNLGYYLTARGKRDIRDVDYLAVANATADAELNTINDWANLQANADVDPMFRLTETRRIQQSMFESMTITGRAVRITANPTFVYALAEAVKEAGLVYDTKFGTAPVQGSARMVPNYMRNLPTGLGNAGGFVASGMRRQGAQGASFGSFGRYSHNNNRSNGQPGSGSGNF